VYFGKKYTQDRNRNDCKLAMSNQGHRLPRAW
jgi:hypothetical protein